MRRACFSKGLVRVAKKRFIPKKLAGYISFKLELHRTNLKIKTVREANNTLTKYVTGPEPYCDF